jgi:hypothetical protein
MDVSPWAFVDAIMVDAARAAVKARAALGFEKRERHADAVTTTSRERHRHQRFR